MQDILDMHFNQQNAKFLFRCLKQLIPPEQMSQMPEAKQLPDDCDYRELFEAYRNSTKNYYINKQIYKVTYDQGKLMKYEQLYFKSPITGLSTQVQHPYMT